MEKITKPKVRSLATGPDLVAKQMEANAGDVLPRHLANIESILFVHEGQCTLRISGKEELLKAGDAYIIPPDTEHQIKAETNFKGVHFMPKDIKFKFFN